MPTYNADIPAATDLISQSQAQIQTNFESIQSLIDVNHVDFDDGVNFGKHNFVSFVQQAAAPGTTATEVALFSQLVGSIVTLFFQPQSNGTPVAVNLSSPYSFTSATITPSGSACGCYTTYLPGGFIIKYGTSSGTGLLPASWSSVNFLPVFPNACRAFIVIPQALSGPPTVPPTSALTISPSLHASGVNVYSSSSATIGLSYIALGN